MHPLLTDRRRLALYLLGWIPIGALVAVGLADHGGWLQAFAVFLPLSLVCAFISLNAGYLCRVFPLNGRVNVWRLVAVQATAAATASAVWVAIGTAWTAALDVAFEGLRAGDLYALRTPLLFVIGALLFCLASVLHYLLIAFEASQEAEHRALELTVLARDAELRALRAQIDPHFLFNSLHSISALTTADPAAARRMCLLLADFLRETQRLGANSRISLADEFALADRFLAIEGVRLGPRLRVTRDTDPEASGCFVPALLLQPLVENAVVHGVSQLVEGGTIHMAASCGASTLTIILENPCDPDRPRRPRSGLGLELLRNRVTTQFGSGGAVRVDDRPEHFRVEVRIPMVTAA